MQDQNFQGTLHKFPDQPVSSAAPISRPPARRSLAGRLILPAVLFVAIVGGLAFLLQYVPSRRNKSAPPAANGITKAIVFHGASAGGPVIRAMWDWIKDDKGQRLDTGYFMEYEHGEPGHYDYSFENIAQGSAEIGLLKTSCDCSSIEMALLSTSEWEQWQQVQKACRPGQRPEDSATKAFSWKPLKMAERGGTSLLVPASARGLLRVSWTSRKSEGQSLNLAVDVWSQPEGKSGQRDYVKLLTGSVIVAPVMFSRPGIPVGVLGPGSSAQDQLFCWSATRDKLNVDIRKDNPLFDFELKQLTQKESRSLERLLRTSAKEKVRPGVDIETDTRVRAAYLLNIKVFEQKGGKQMDQGPFYEPIPVRLDGEMLTRGVPIVRGTVRGEVDVGAADDQGRINMGTFPANAGGKKSIILWTNHRTTLKLAQHSPDTLQVRLSENTKDSTPQRKSWRLIVEVPRGIQAGPLPEDSAVILHTQSTPPRQIRIPIVGTAVQG